MRRLEPLYSFRVIVNGAGRHSLFVSGDLAYPAARAQLDPRAQRMRPEGDVDARLRALGAPRRAMAEIDALAAPVIFGFRYGDVGRPPMPTELVHRSRVPSAGLPQRHRRHGG